MPTIASATCTADQLISIHENGLVAETSISPASFLVKSATKGNTCEFVHTNSTTHRSLTSSLDDVANENSPADEHDEIMNRKLEETEPVLLILQKEVTHPVHDISKDSADADTNKEEEDDEEEEDAHSIEERLQGYDKFLMYSSEPKKEKKPSTWEEDNISIASGEESSLDDDEQEDFQGKVSRKEKSGFEERNQSSPPVLVKEQYNAIEVCLSPEPIRSSPVDRTFSTPTLKHTTTKPATQTKLMDSTVFNCALLFHKCYAFDVKNVAITNCSTCIGGSQDEDDDEDSGDSENDFDSPRNSTNVSKIPSSFRGEDEDEKNSSPRQQLHASHESPLPNQSPLEYPMKRRNERREQSPEAKSDIGAFHRPKLFVSTSTARSDVGAPTTTMFQSPCTIRTNEDEVVRSRFSHRSPSFRDLLKSMDTSTSATPKNSDATTSIRWMKRNRLMSQRSTTTTTSTAVPVTASIPSSDSQLFLQSSSSLAQTKTTSSYKRPTDWWSSSSDNHSVATTETEKMKNCNSDNYSHDGHSTEPLVACPSAVIQDPYSQGTDTTFVEPDVQPCNDHKFIWNHPSADKALNDFLLELTDIGLVLRYHSDYSFSQSKHPPCVVLKLKMSHDNTTPALSWVGENNIQKSIHVIDDLKAICNATDKDLCSRPDAATNKLFCLSLKDCKTEIFEAKSEKEKRRIIQGLNAVFDWITSPNFYPTVDDIPPTLSLTSYNSDPISNTKDASHKGGCDETTSDSSFLDTLNVPAELCIPKSTGSNSTFIHELTSSEVPRHFLSEIFSTGIELWWHHPEDRNKAPHFAILKLDVRHRHSVALPILTWIIEAVDDPEVPLYGELFLLDVTSIDWVINVPKRGFEILSKSSPPVIFEALNEQEQQRILRELRSIISKLTYDAVSGQGVFDWFSDDECSSWEADLFVHALLDDLKPRPTIVHA